MKSKLLATAGAAALALTMSATVSRAGYMQPGETLGVSLLSPLPEGVFFNDLEDYGRSHLTSTAAAQGPNVGVGVNIPVIVWSTPFSFYNTRLEFLLATPFAHLDGFGTDRIGAITTAFGPLFAHDFGNGLTGGIGALIRTPSPSANLQDIDGRTATEADFRESLQYAIKGGPFDGVTLLQNAAFTSCLCSNYGPTTVSANGVVGRSVQNDMFAGDFAIEKTIGKFTFGVAGYGNIDTDNRAALVFRRTEPNIAVGGLIAYDFGKFSLIGIVTRTVIDGAVAPSVSVGYETRGWFRLIVPLYMAPTAAPIVARY